MSNFLLVNFGGPRNLEEVETFLISLLCDRDLIQTRFPSFFHNWFFRRIARKRAQKVRIDYEEIGGKSPIYFDTEKIGQLLSDKIEKKIYTFHRYLPMTHPLSMAPLKSLPRITVLPLFPQFSYATTGSIARVLSPDLGKQLWWIKSYAGHPAFIRSYQRRIADFLEEHKIQEEEAILLFSAHGVPKKFIQRGDPYESECILSFQKVMQGFPKALGKLSYQSKFGRGEWIQPYTDQTCEEILSWHEGRKKIIFVPISFTSDHIETLFEIEKLYLPIIRAKGLNAYRCPALNCEPYWIDALAEILQDPILYPNNALIRKT